MIPMQDNNIENELILNNRLRLLLHSGFYSKEIIINQILETLKCNFNLRDGQVSFDLNNRLIFINVKNDEAPIIASNYQCINSSLYTVFNFNKNLLSNLINLSYKQEESYYMNFLNNIRNIPLLYDIRMLNDSIIISL